MTITPQQLIALLPLLIVGLTVVVVMLSIAWRRNHFLNAADSGHLALCDEQHSAVVC